MENYTLRMDSMQQYVLKRKDFGGVGDFGADADRIFCLMPLVIGVPQLVLNLGVVLSVMVITRLRPAGNNGGGVGTNSLSR